MSERKKCRQCGADVRSEDRFCASCGTNIEGTPLDQKTAAGNEGPVVCASCGVLNPASNIRCFSCGSPMQTGTAHTGRSSDPKQSASRTAKSGSLRFSLSSQIIAAFAVFVIVIIIVESQNRPAGGETPSPRQQQESPPQSEKPTGEVLSQIAMFEAAVKSDPANADAQLQLANILHDAKFYPRAIETYKKYIALVPKATDARVDMAICYFESGDGARAIQEIKTAISIDPKHQMAMFNLGVIYLSSNNVPESKKWLQRCIDIDPQSVAGQRARDILHQH